MSDLLTPIQKRDILYGVKKTTPAQLSELAQRFQAEGWLSDAADFFSQADNREGLIALRKLAADEGDFFLYQKTHRYLGEGEGSEAELRACAEKAESSGKLRYAMKAFEKLGQTDRVEAIRARIAQDGDIVAEAQSTVFIPASEDELADDEASTD